MDLLFVGLGGFFGAITRFWISATVSDWLARQTTHKLPYGTAFVNISGSFLLGCLLAIVELAPHLKLLIGTGFFGAYTTYSTFATETAILARRGQTLLAALNVLINTSLSIAMCFAGYQLVQGLG